MKKFESQPKNILILGKVVESLCEDYAIMRGVSNKHGLDRIKDIISKGFDKDAIYNCIVKN